MNSGKIIILAAGVSSRMKKPFKVDDNFDKKVLLDADNKPKSMISVGENKRPFLDYLLYNIREAGYREVVIVVGADDNSIMDYYSVNNSDNDFLKLKISYAVQVVPAGRAKPLGTADALYWGLKSKPEWCNDQVTVCNSDNLYSVKALKLLLQSEYAAAMIEYDRCALQFEPERINRFAVTKKNSKNFLIDIVEKPTTEVIESFKDKNGFVGVSMNIFSLKYELIMPYLEKMSLNTDRDEKELPGAIKMLAHENNNCIYCFSLAEHVPDLTSKSDITKVKNYLEQNFRNFSFD